MELFDAFWKLYEKERIELKETFVLDFLNLTWKSMGQRGGEKISDRLEWLRGLVMGYGVIYL